MADKLTKLSQAIRLGATFRPQCVGELFLGGKSCAIAAAYEAITGMYGSFGEHPAHVSMRRFGVDQETLTEVMDRNNSGETREQIAEWLEGQGL